MKTKESTLNSSKQKDIKKKNYDQNTLLYSPNVFYVYVLCLCMMNVHVFLRVFMCINVGMRATGCVEVESDDNLGCLCFFTLFSTSFMLFISWSSRIQRICFSSHWRSTQIPDMSYHVWLYLFWKPELQFSHLYSKFVIHLSRLPKNLQFSNVFSHHLHCRPLEWGFNTRTFYIYFSLCRTHANMWKSEDKCRSQKTTYTGFLFPLKGLENHI